MLNQRFQPIAIVGQGCVLPGCLSPEALWRTVRDGISHVGPSPSGDWRLNVGSVLGPANGTEGRDWAWTDRGGYVGALDSELDLSCASLAQDLVAKLDPVFRWSLHAAGQALRGLSRGDGGREGLVLGNLSYPTRSHTRLAEHYWLNRAGIQSDEEPPDELNRFMSGSPALLVAQAYGLAGGALSLDASCASSLYAVKVACDRLQEGEADLMLAGGVNAVDQFFLHTGLTALNALSRTGRSRPFHAGADGLIPAEGAAFVALKRVEDALAAGDPILGVIRGLGLSNNGRSGGFLSPSRDGQARAMRAALEDAGLSPDAVQYVECHATGTLLGDATEIRSLTEIYGRTPLALGSLKANLGHPMTASGIAGLIKTMAAMADGVMPGIPQARPQAAALGATPFIVPDTECLWHMVQDQRTAAISNFGFGGANAHLILQQFPTPAGKRPAVPRTAPAGDIVIVGMGVRTHVDPNTAAFLGRLLGEQRADSAFDADSLSFEARKLAFPLAQLERALGQQISLIEVARQALATVAPLDHLRTGVYIGMQADSRVCLHGVRSRWRERLAAAGIDDPALLSAGDALVAPLDSAAVIGAMPNITASRLSNQYDFQAASFAVSREELSGDAALALARTALGRGEIDAALVGAVDLCREPVHQAAARMLGRHRSEAADAAVMLVLKTRASAEAAGDPILAALSDAGPTTLALRNDENSSPVGRFLGHAHAASGLLHLALGVGMLRSRTRLDGSGRPQPWLRDREPLALNVHNRSFLGESAAWRIVEGVGRPQPNTRPLLMERYAARDRETLLTAIRAGQAGEAGPCRLAIVGTANELPELRKRALHKLQSNRASHWMMAGISFREAPLAGEMAFTFASAASAYSGMGRSLLLGMPFLTDRLALRCAGIGKIADALHHEGDAGAATPFQQLAGASFLSQLHATLSLDVLKLKPGASIGLSSGETNAMHAFGVWRDVHGFLEEVSSSGLYAEALAGRFDAARDHWGTPPGTLVAWINLRVRAPAADVAAAVAQQDRAYLSIIHSHGDSVISGDPDACRAVLAALGAPVAIPVGHDCAMHCAAVSPCEATWRQVHTRAAFPPTPPVRFYSSALGSSFEPTPETIANTLIDQAFKTLDLPQVVNRAWEDGVRIFVEHGPRSSLTRAIGEILRDREHLAVSLDRMGIAGDLQAWRTAAALWCAGVEIDVAALERPAVMPAFSTPKGPLVHLTLRKKPSTALPPRNYVAKVPHHDLQA